MPKQGSRYAWFVLFLLVLISAIPMVLFSNTFSYYQAPVSEALGCTYLEFNLAATAGVLCNIIFGILLATKISEGKTRYFMLAGGVIAGACFILMGQASNIWMIVALYALGNFCFCAVSFIPCNVLISAWFVDKRATATSIWMAGMGLGATLLTPVVSGLIANDWRNSLMISGIVIAAVPFVTSWFLKKPEEMDREPLMPKGGSSTHDVADTTSSAWQGLTKSQAMRTGAFFVYLLVCICCGVVSAGVSTQMPAFFVDNGVDYTSRMMAFQLFYTVGFLVLGVLIDKLGIKVSTVLAGGLMIVALVCMIVAPHSDISGYVTAITFALGSGIAVMAPPLLTSTTFGVKEYGGIYGLGNSAYMAGAMVGPLLSSGIRTVMGSYSPAWIAFVGISIVLIVGVFLTVAMGVKLRTSKQILR